MKILIDAQLPPALAALLVGAGHQARHVAEVGLRDATDPAVWDHALRERAVIFAKDEDFWRLNTRILRNNAPVNFLDRCAITIPISPPGEAPVGLMAVGRHGEDRRLLAMALGIEALVERECRS